MEKTKYTISSLLSNWQTAYVDLNRNNGMFKLDNVRLRNCSLHFNESSNEYYIKYSNVTFGLFDIYNMRTY